MAREIKAPEAALVGHMREVLAESGLREGIAPNKTFSAPRLHDLAIAADNAIAAVNAGDPEGLVPLPSGGYAAAGLLIDLWHLAAFLDEGFRDED